MRDRPCRRGFGQLQRGHRHHVLARNLEWRAACREHPHVRRCSDDPGNKLGGRFENVLTVVDDKEEMLVLEIRGEDLNGFRRSLISQVQRGDHGVGYQRWIVQVGKLDQPGTVREPTPEVVCRTDRQPRLSDASRTHEADDSSSRQLLADLGQLSATPNKAGRFRWKVARSAPWPGHDPCSVRDEHLRRRESSIHTICAARRRGQPREHDTTAPTQRVHVTFVGTPPARQVARAIGGQRRRGQRPPADLLCEWQLPAIPRSVARFRGHHLHVDPNAGRGRLMAGT